MGTNGPSSGRMGAGSPLHDPASRLFPKRTRELQGRDGLSPSIWGPPTSGNSTPLRETIPESPSQDGFPDLVPPSEAGLSSPARRARAGTVPSRFSPVGTINGVSVQQSLLSKTSRPTPSTSPFNLQSGTPTDSASKGPPLSSSNAALLSRLRAGSMPQRPDYSGATSPFGTSLFSSNWNASRDRSTTLTSIRSSEDPNSPTQSGTSRDGMIDTDVRTLDYLGLVETPQQSRATLSRPLNISATLQHQQPNVLPQLLADYNNLRNNRFRSYSVNAGEKYVDGDAEDPDAPFSGYQSGNLTPSAAATAAQMSILQSQIDQHNQAVQAYARNVSAARPRARTAGMLDTPSQRPLRSYLPTRLDTNISEASTLAENVDIAELGNSVDLMQLNGTVGPHEADQLEEGSHMSRSLWIGSIPVSTTNTSLDAIFGRFGTIESTRVLTHKNCGFVNFDTIANAVKARQALNGKEIFPGAGSVRIGFAKAPNTSIPDTTGLGGMETGTLDYRDEPGSETGVRSAEDNVESQMARSYPKAASMPPAVPQLYEMHHDLLQIVSQFGATTEDMHVISNNIDRAVAFEHLEREIPPIPELSHVRIYDAPRLRDVRKRIDSGAYGLQEIEQIATDMLPEIAELASDYLGNTVVQKLFELCSEHTKDNMLTRIAPHLAEIGVHKNGTWAAQKIIDVCKTPQQMNMIVSSLRPYTIPLFLDQYGNYVLQCCLRFGSPYNDFIFETMVSSLWEIAQGRFGARAMRACLESHYSTKHQQRMLAAAIAIHSVQLATNTNGALLLTWFLDTCNFPQRRTVLAPNLVSHIVHLCTHKVAYLTVLKVINQRNEPDARDIILRSLFFSAGDAILEQILSDQSSGATLIFKVLTTPFFDDSMRSEVSKNVAKVLTRIKAQPSQGYKRLMDEVGLSRTVAPAHPVPSHGHPVGSDRPRPMSQHGSVQPAQSATNSYNLYGQSMSNSSFENLPSVARSGSADSLAYPQYGLNGPPSYIQSPLQPSTPQQYQYHTYMAASQRPNSSYMPTYPTNGYGGYATPPPTMDAYRHMQHHGSPLTGPAPMATMMNVSAYPQQHYNPNMSANGYGFPQHHVFSPQMQAIQGGGRRVRVSSELDSMHLVLANSIPEVKISVFIKPSYSTSSLHVPSLYYA